ncbi:hypothetical protein ACQEPX_012270 [Xanthomonas oryzae pv. oryzicola]|uniref:hypothetical protein n=1 Tax=Xanthomonas oryzae TaxID=347 RepID=UPI003DA04644
MPAIFLKTMLINHSLLHNTSLLFGQPLLAFHRLVYQTRFPTAAGNVLSASSGHIARSNANVSNITRLINALINDVRSLRNSGGSLGANRCFRDALR